MAVIDGNLNEGDESGQDGEAIAVKIKTEHPYIKIVGRAAEKSIKAADVNCPKIENYS